MRTVREVSDESLVPVDGTVSVVGWTRPPRARHVLAEYNSESACDPGRSVRVGPGFVRVPVSRDRPLFTLQLLDGEPSWELPGWQSTVSGAEIFPGMRVSCTVDRSGAPGEVGLNLPGEPEPARGEQVLLALRR
ncbi:hypothetical protein ACXR2U_13130 [Jatrophihabitans sp. YIM 134969]